MNQSFKQLILEATGAISLEKLEVMQSLWSGYGEISRYKLKAGVADNVVIKHVILPSDEKLQQGQHPRGWNTQLSHQRKIQSYEVESIWYRDFSSRCDDQCRVPKCYGLQSGKGEFLMILEDLDAHGFPIRNTQASLSHMKACLDWLAAFHGNFLTHSTISISSESGKGLWQSGCYWHLDTRPDEWEALKDEPLKAAASEIDQLLKNTPYQTLVHGDAKLANFCFSKDNQKVAAVDFQYVGKGCGMKDVAYFIGSCLDGAGCEQYAESLLDYYFQRLNATIVESKSAIDPAQVEKQWRPLFAVAWADFQRFLKGWSPDHWKVHDYSEKLTQQVLRELGFN